MKLLSKLEWLVMAIISLLCIDSSHQFEIDDHIQLLLQRIGLKRFHVKNRS